MTSPSGYPAPLGEAPLVAGAIQAAVETTAPQATSEAAPPCEEQTTNAEGTSDGTAGVPISDKMMERLMQSLGDMEADYARTLAAGECRPTPLEQPGDADPEAATAGEGGAEAGSESHDEDNEGGGGYMMIGSDDGGSDADPDEVESTAPAGAEAGGSGWPAPPQVDDADFQDFQGSHLESFADFGSSNPLLPPPPHGLPQWAATPLTDVDVQFIKDTMKLVEPTPPPWAQNLRDAELSRMVRAALWST